MGLDPTISQKYCKSKMFQVNIVEACINPFVGLCCAVLTLSTYHVLDHRLAAFDSVVSSLHKDGQAYFVSDAL